MAQVFRARTNTIFRVALVGAILGLVLLIFTFDRLQRGSHVTAQNVPVEQTPPFSHKHHAGSLGIDCRYCHTSVETGPFAGIPPTKTCWNCHKTIWNQAPMLQPVRDSWATGKPLEWTRVHDLPQFAYFNHSIHVNKGIGCATCHGRIDQMPLVRRENTLYMSWCLDCHRDPTPFIRPKDKVTDMAYSVTPEQQAVIGPRLIGEYNVNTNNLQLLDCSNCHR